MLNYKTNQEVQTVRDYIAATYPVDEDLFIADVEEIGQPIIAQATGIDGLTFIDHLTLDDHIDLLHGLTVDGRNWHRSVYEYMIFFGANDRAITLCLGQCNYYQSYRFQKWQEYIMEDALCIAEGSQSFCEQRMLLTYESAIDEYLSEIDQQWMLYDEFDEPMEETNHIYSKLIGSPIHDYMRTHFMAMMSVDHAEDWQYRDMQKAIKTQRRNLREVKDLLSPPAV